MSIQVLGDPVDWRRKTMPVLWDNPPQQDSQRRSLVVPILALLAIVAILAVVSCAIYPAM